MNSKNKEKKSAIPPKLQISLAIVLGIVFMFLLTARLRGRLPSPAVNDEPSSDETAAMTSRQRRVGLLIDEISGKEEGSGNATEQELPELPSDPFAEPDRTTSRGVLSKLGRLPRGLRSQQRGGEDNGGEYDGKSREEFIESLALQATLRDGNLRIALISGKLCAENCTIGRFKLVKVGERVALLSDDTGNVLLRMKGDDER